jgi:hypothetical protein
MLNKLNSRLKTKLEGEKEMSKLYDLVVIDVDAIARVTRIPANNLTYWDKFFQSNAEVWTVKAFRVKDYVGELERIPPASQYITKTALAKIWLDIQYERVDCFYYSKFVEFCGDVNTAFKSLKEWQRANPKAIKKGNTKEDSDCIMFGNN